MLVLCALGSGVNLPGDRGAQGGARAGAEALRNGGARLEAALSDSWARGAGGGKGWSRAQE
eukprot:XP_001699118.1 predicted protein [Chlamydomonas reinhardtii]